MDDNDIVITYSYPEEIGFLQYYADRKRSTALAGKHRVLE